MANEAAGAGPAVGERIRRTREDRGLTVRELASRSNLSVGLISQVERGITDPSLQTPRVIAKILRTPLFDFFATPESADVAVVRADARVALGTPHGGLTYSRLPHRYLNPTDRPARFTLAMTPPSY